jgi:hypothetical protein
MGIAWTHLRPIMSGRGVLHTASSDEDACEQDARSRAATRLSLHSQPAAKDKLLAPTSKVNASKRADHSNCYALCVTCTGRSPSPPLQ